VLGLAVLIGCVIVERTISEIVVGCKTVETLLTTVVTRIVVDPCDIVDVAVEILADKTVLSLDTVVTL
jgi:hypothetical protein